MTEEKLLSPKAIRLLRKAIKRGEEEPARMNIYRWLERFGPTTAAKDLARNYLGQKKLPACRTVGCIAGNIIVVAKAEGKIDGAPSIPRLAAELLGLHVADTERLFWPGGWPEPFYSRLMKTKRGTKAHVEAIKARVEHWIATDGAE